MVHRRFKRRTIRLCSIYIVYTIVYASHMSKTDTKQFVGMREFRQNIAEYVRRARESGNSFVVMQRSKPLFEVRPYAENVELDEIALLREARADAVAGRVYTEAEIIEKHS